MTDYTRDIMATLAPGIATLTSERRTRRDRLLGQLRKTAMVAGALALLLLFAGGGLFMLALVGGVGFGAWLVNRTQKDWEEKVRAEIIPPVCAALGDLHYQPKPADENFLAPFDALGLVGEHNRQVLEHYFSGSDQGRRFECLHARLNFQTKGKRGTSIPVFHGMLFRIEHGSDVPAPVVILPNVTTLKRQTGKTLVELGNADFDRTFLVSYDPTTIEGAALVHTVVTPALQTALLAINSDESRETVNVAALRVGFMYDSVYIGLSRWEQTSTIGGLKVERPRRFLQTRLLLREQADVHEAVATMVEDITTVHRIIAALGNSA
ncbi:MAG: DUF3137 domain-containing protein [Haliea sp.]